MDLIQKSILSSYLGNFRAEFIQLRTYLMAFFFPYSQTKLYIIWVCQAQSLFPFYSYFYT